MRVLDRLGKTHEITRINADIDGSYSIFNWAIDATDDHNVITELLTLVDLDKVKVYLYNFPKLLSYAADHNRHDLAKKILDVYHVNPLNIEYKAWNLRPQTNETDAALSKLLSEKGITVIDLDAQDAALDILVNNFAAHVLDNAAAELLAEQNGHVQLVGEEFFN